MFDALDAQPPSNGLVMRTVLRFRILPKRVDSDRRPPRFRTSRVLTSHFPVE